MNPMPKILLHQWQISPFCHKVRKILQRKQLPYSIVNYNGLLATKVSHLSSIGKLPVLEYNNQKIQDSSDIAEFLEAHHPENPLYPTDSTQRSHTYFWEDWADESLYWYEVYFRFMYPDALKIATGLLCEGRPKFEEWIIGTMAPYLYKKQLRAQGIGRLDPKRVERKFFQHLGNLDTLLSQQDWLVGNHQTIADIAVFAQLEEIISTSHLREQILSYPHLRHWREQN